MKIGAIYVRKSILTGKGESIQSQIEMCKSYAENQGIVIDERLIYCDEGYSGKDINRPSFKQMLVDLKANKFNTLLCYRLDRISRCLNDFSNLINTMNKINTSFVSIKENFDTSTPMGKSMMYIASVFSELERETISERVRDNISNLARSGRWLGGVSPTGFKSTLISSLDNNFNKSQVYQLSFIDSEIALVKLLFTVFLKLKDLAALEKYCFIHNLKSKNKLPFTQTSLKQILINPVYCKADKYLYDYLYSKNFTISNHKNDFTGNSSVLLYKINNQNIISLAKHKGVIESQDWIYVQKIISQNNKIPSRQGTSSIGLLSGLVYCDICNSLMRVKYGRKTKNGVSYYYLCTWKEKNRSNCNSLNLRGIYMDDLILGKIKTLFQSNELNNVLTRFLKFLYEDRTFTKKNSEIPIDNSKNKIGYKYLKNRLNRLNSQANNDINSSSYKYILEEIKSIENNILNINKLSAYSDTAKASIKLDNILKYYYDIVITLDIINLSFEEKKYFLNKVLSSLYWDNSNINVFFE